MSHNKRRPVHHRLLFAFMKKEILHIIRDRRTLLFLFGLPVSLVFLFGYAVTNEFKNARVGFVETSPSSLGRQLFLHLNASGHFQMLTVQRKDLDQLFARKQIDLAVVLDSGFSRDVFLPAGAEIQVIADGTEPNTAATLVAYLNIMVDRFSHSLALRTAPSVRVSTRMLYNPRLESAYNFLPGTVALILLLISAMMSALTLSKEKELGTMEVLLVSPLPPALIIIGKIAPYGLLAFFDAIVVLVLGYFVFDVPIRGSLLLLLAVCLLYVVTALALGIFIGIRSANQQVAMMFSLVSLMMPSMLLSGFIFPLEGMPAVLQYIGSVIPATYFVIVLKGIMLKGLGVTALWRPITTLTVMLVILFAVSARAFKVRLE